MPEVRVNQQQRRAITERAGGCCEYCRSPLKYSPDPFTAEHIVPRHLGGQTKLDNLALACMGCNGYKYTRIEFADPGSNQVVPLFNPRRNLWPEHFAWNEGCTHMIGLSATGRATIEALRLNRPNLVNLRRLLYAAGEHPPEIAH